MRIEGIMEFNWKKWGRKWIEWFDKLRGPCPLVRKYRPSAGAPGATAGRGLLSSQSYYYLLLAHLNDLHLQPLLLAFSNQTAGFHTISQSKSFKSLSDRRSSSAGKNKDFKEAFLLFNWLKLINRASCNFIRSESRVFPFINALYDVSLSRGFPSRHS